MGSTSGRAALRAVEFHHFAIDDRWLLFDVHALHVIPSCELDGMLLELAREPRPRAEIVQAATARGMDRSEVVARIRELRRHRFLLAPHERVRAAELGSGTSYATFMVNVAQRCNLTCSYCYVNKGLFDYEEKPIARMAKTTAAALIDQIHTAFPHFRSYGYHFYGGEPLLNFDVIRMLVEDAEARAAQDGTKTEYHITTNGTLLTREVADFMDEHAFTVYFSIDGDQETHDELRTYVNGRGSFDDVERNLEYLRTRERVHLIGSSVIRKGFTLQDGIKLLEDHGAKQCKAERVRLRDDDPLALTGDDHDRYLADVRRLIDHYVDYLTSGRKPMDFRLSSKILQVLTRKRRNFFCPAGDRMFGISANGEIYPCALHVGRPQSKIGDVEHGVDVEKQQAFRRKFSAEHQEGCQTCWTRNLCGGGCSAMVDRFGHEDCDALRAESEAAIAIYQHFAERDLTLLYGLVSPKMARWVRGELNDPGELLPTEAASLHQVAEE